MSAGSASFAYDPLDRLYRQGASGTILRYAGADTVTELDANGNVRRRYVPGDGGDEPILWYEGAGNGDRRWYHQDELGSVVALSDANASGRILTYDPYGIPGAGNAQVQSRYGYTGQTWLREIGAWHYKARPYSATLGRFLQPDPIGYGDGMNMYAYVGGDPVNYRDPFGTDAWCADRTFFTDAELKKLGGESKACEGHGGPGEVGASAGLNRGGGGGWFAGLVGIGGPSGGFGGGTASGGTWTNPPTGPLASGFVPSCTAPAPFQCAGVSNEKPDKPAYCSNVDYRLAKAANTLGKLMSAGGAIGRFVPHPFTRVASTVAGGLGGAISAASDFYIGGNYPDVRGSTIIGASVTAGTIMKRAGASVITSVAGGQAVDTILNEAIGDPCD